MITAYYEAIIVCTNSKKLPFDDILKELHGVIQSFSYMKTTKIHALTMERFFHMLADYLDQHDIMVQLVSDNDHKKKLYISIYTCGFHLSEMPREVLTPYAKNAQASAVFRYLSHYDDFINHIPGVDPLQLIKIESEMSLQWIESVFKGSSIRDKGLALVESVRAKISSQ
jgi:hypothetical protein